MTLLKIPKRLPLLIIRNDYLLPGSSARIPIMGAVSMNMVKGRFLSRNTLASSIIGIVTAEDGNSFEKSVTNPNSKMIGTAAFVLQVVGSAWPKSNSFTLHVSGICRFSLDKLVMEEPYPMGVVTQLDYLSFEKDAELSTDCKELLQKLRETAVNMLNSISSLPGVTDIQETIQNASDIILPDLIMSMVQSSSEDRKKVLYAINSTDRINAVLPVLQKQSEFLKGMKKNVSPSKPEFIVVTLPSESKSRRVKGGEEMFDLSDGVNEIDELQNKIVKANLPVEVNKVVMRDLHRLKRAGLFSQESSVYRNYIEFVVELPWSISSAETIDVNKARTDLDKEHYGMDKVKQRVLEYLAVRQLKSTVGGPILFLVGPPGVGKTSIARSIAQTLGRQFQRISLGGVSMHSDIRGHRRTYIGAMPGRIIQAIKTAAVNNPVILLDEIDKMSHGPNGDPASALLEVLDPLQNHHFVDHYLNVPFDLSLVTFIATANQIRTVPAPLLDRMETITVSGYTLEEKKHIGENHLLPKQLADNGLDDSMMKVPLDCLQLLIQSYTLEAGVRDLERRLGALCRAVAVKVAEEKNSGESLTLPVEITPEALEKILGPPPYTAVEVSDGRVGTPGVAVGMAWTPAGGNILIVEASKLAGGEGKLILTGHLGDVMKESAHLALNWVRGVAHQYGFIQEGEDLMYNTDVHIHFPEGAVGKEGPSAGITIAAALISLFAEVPLVSGLAISGELTLRGVVLPVGGVREKILAAHRAGLKKVILPKQCIKDLFNVPESVKDEMSFLFASHMEEVIDAAFDGLVVPISQRQTTFQSRL